MENLYIVVYRYDKTSRWQPKIDGAFQTLALAEGFRAALADINPTWEYIVMEAMMVIREQKEEGITA